MKNNVPIKHKSSWRKTPPTSETGRRWPKKKLSQAKGYLRSRCRLIETLSYWVRKVRCNQFSLKWILAGIGWLMKLNCNQVRSRASTLLKKFHKKPYSTEMSRLPKQKKLKRRLTQLTLAWRLVMSTHSLSTLLTTSKAQSQQYQ